MSEINNNSSVTANKNKTVDAALATMPSIYSDSDDTSSYSYSTYDSSSSEETRSTTPQQQATPFGARIVSVSRFNGTSSFFIPRMIGTPPC